MAFKTKPFCRYSIYALAMLLLLLFNGSSGAAEPYTHVVIIDPAHGGDDSGVTADKFKEKDLTLQLATMIRQEARKISKLDVKLVRASDKTISNEERVNSISSLKGDCIISLHANASFGNKATGYEIYFPGFQQEVSVSQDPSPIIRDMTRNKSLNDAVRLAQNIQAGLEKVLPRKGRGLRDAPSPLLDKLAIPGLVVEMGFATNPDDRKKMNHSETQKAIVNAILNGLQEYFSTLP